MGTASQSASSTTSAAGEMASGVQDKVAAAEDKMSQAPAQLRRQTAGNPLAVGLIAVGVGWLVGSLLPGTSAEERAAAKVKETAAPAITGAAKETAASLQDFRVRRQAQPADQVGDDPAPRLEPPVIGL